MHIIKILICQVPLHSQYPSYMYEKIKKLNVAKHMFEGKLMTSSQKITICALKIMECFILNIYDLVYLISLETK